MNCRPLSSLTRSRWAALGALCILTVAAQAQAPPPVSRVQDRPPVSQAQDRPPAAQQQPLFRSGVELVAIDVTVVDRSGTPIAGLAPGDFKVTVDGAPRRVVSAQFINFRGAAPATPQKSVPGPGPATAAAPVGRNVVVVIDEDSIETEDAMVARRAAQTLLDGLSVGDRVGVNMIPRLRSNFTLTTDRAENRKALASWVPGVYREAPGKYWIGVSEAIEIAAMDQTTTEKVAARECADPRTGRVNANCAREIVAEARQLARRSAAHATQTLDALRALGRGLRQIEGPKTIVLVSGGIFRPESTSSLTAVEAEFAAAQITLYSLFFEKSEQSGSRYRLSPTQGEDDRLGEDGLANVTSAAGGTFLRVIGTAETYFQRVATELSAEYLLGIEVSPGDRDGRPHRVTIKVNRPRLDVHGRKQYVIPVGVVTSK